MANRIDATDRFGTLAAVAALALLSFGVAVAQTPATLGSGNGQSADTEWTALSAAELEELIGPVALYPDDLIAIVLPASTFPLQIVQASRYLEQTEANSELEPDAAWDESVVALLNYPEVLQLLNDDLDWTWTLGEAVIYQQGDILNAVQAFRDRAYAAGNLATDERQEVVAADDGTITIAPADPEVIYVPYYDPARVVVRHHVPVYHYYPYAYPVYYYPYPTGYSFGSRLFWGVTTAFAIGWSDHYLHVRHHSHFGHPYYGYNYYTPWYARTNIYVNVNRVGSYNRWRPGYRQGRYRHGGRPRHYVRYDRQRNRGIIDARRNPQVQPNRMRDRQINHNSESRRDVIGTRDGRLQRNQVRNQRRDAQLRPTQTNRRSADRTRDERLQPSQVRNQPRATRSQPRLTNRRSADRTRDGQLQPNRVRNQPRAAQSQPNQVRNQGARQSRPTLRERSIEDRRVRRNPDRVARSGAGRTQLPGQARDTSNRGRQLTNRSGGVAQRANPARNNGARSATRDLRTDRRNTRAAPNRNVVQNRGGTLTSPRMPRTSSSNGRRSSELLGRSAAPQRAPAPRSARGGINREQPIRPPTARQVRPNRAPAANRGANTPARVRPQQNRAQPRAQRNPVRMQPQRAAPPSRGSGQRSGGRSNRRAR